MKEDKIQEAAEAMFRTERIHKMLIDSRAKELGMHRTQHRILMYLARKGSLPSQKELADHLDITPAAVTGALKKIETEGYVERTLGKDNRFNELRITEKGRALVDKTREMFSSTDRSLFEGFTDEELIGYINCLQKLQNNIKSHLGCEILGGKIK